MHQPYIGRFAPSPTGPLHFGSLVAAVASYLDARAHSGKWFVRIEDVDTAREVPGATHHILETLEAFGFEWDGAIIFQKHRDALYSNALQQLIAAGDVYGCACSRREISEALSPDVDVLYPGTCRNGLPLGKTARAWRLRVQDKIISFEDRVQGTVTQSLAHDVGDFILKRADGYWAYQLAVVVDDAAQGVTHVVRGADLLDSTPRQIFLQRRLGVATPVYLHVPTAVNAAGEKLSKQTLAPEINPEYAAEQLAAALAFLGQKVPPGAGDDLAALWKWATENWDVALIPRLRTKRQNHP